MQKFKIEGIGLNSIRETKITFNNKLKNNYYISKTLKKFNIRKDNY
uniref:Uncharacterized protein n=1 Tax=Meloidogyne enterolobii TaxID=390850 RepID=A0A6V7XQR9_MELEN|nr:unnamed protein product [Meloidogyne enterolobii]